MRRISKIVVAIFPLFLYSYNGSEEALTTRSKNAPNIFSPVLSISFPINLIFDFITTGRKKPQRLDRKMYPIFSLTP